MIVQSSAMQVGAKESLKEGSVLFIPSAVSQEPNEIGLMKNHQEVTPEDIKWLRSLVLHKACHFPHAMACHLTLKG